MLRKNSSIDNTSFPWGKMLQFTFLGGFGEFLLFHPGDTIATRLQVKNNGVTSFITLKNVIFQQNIYRTPFQQFCGLYAGGIAGSVLRISKFTYKGIGQLYLTPKLATYTDKPLDPYLNHDGKNVFNEAVIATNVSLIDLPMTVLDTIKTKYQSNTMDKGLYYAFKTENLFTKALGVTIVRNSVGSAYVFIVPELIKRRGFGVSPKEETAKHKLAASGIATGTALTILQPLDVIKSRVQAHQGKISSFSVFKNTLDEGLGAFFNGIGVKGLTSGTKLLFSLTIIQYLRQYYLSIQESELQSTPRPK